MNRLVPQDIHSINASTWFSAYLREKCVSQRETIKLAKAVGLERKLLMNYALGRVSPKLDVVAKVMAYYGEKEIRIPI